METNEKEKKLTCIHFEQSPLIKSVSHAGAEPELRFSGVKIIEFIEFRTNYYLGQTNENGLFR